MINAFMPKFALAYTLGDKISIDESMIKYCGWYVSFVQYMPKKPIKHVLKEFAICCVYTGFLTTFQIYTGNEGRKEGTPKTVIGRLLQLAAFVGLISTTGRILYTDNWYTS